MQCHSTTTRIPANTKYLYNICTMLDQRRRRWAGVVQMLYKCFVFAGIWHTFINSKLVNKSLPLKIKRAYLPLYKVVDTILYSSVMRKLFNPQGVIYRHFIWVLTSCWPLRTSSKDNRYVPSLKSSNRSDRFALSAWENKIQQQHQHGNAYTDEIFFL